MHTITVDVDEIEAGEHVPGFSGEATVTVKYLDLEDFDLSDVEIVVWRHGHFRTQPASDELAEAIRREIWDRNDTLYRISREIAADMAERRYLARDRHFAREA